MPTYEYECKKCGHRFEVYQSMKDDRLTDCPESGCGGEVKRLIGAGAGLIFKGSGFYITDYRSDSYKQAAKSDSSSSKSSSDSGGSPGSSSKGGEKSSQSSASSSASSSSKSKGSSTPST